MDIDRVRHAITEMAVSDDYISSGDAKGKLLPSWVPGSNHTGFNFLLLGNSSINSCLFYEVVRQNPVHSQIQVICLICFFLSFHSPEYNALQ
jgi:hypothetical protein